MKNIRRLSFILAVILVSLFCIPMGVYADEVSNAPAGDALSPQAPFAITSGNAAVVYCVDNGQVLYSTRFDEETDAVVTAPMVACMVASDILNQKGLKSDEVVIEVSESAVSYINRLFNENTADRIFVDFRMPTMGFSVGGIYTAKDMFSSILVAGSNDACAIIAAYFGENYLGGDINTFVEKMNEKVAELGLEKTKFVTPTALSAVGHVTTPGEAAKIAAAFCGYNELVTLSDVGSFSLSAGISPKSKNAFESDTYLSGYKSDITRGLAVGQPNADGNYCLITSTQNDSLTYIYVVMCAPSVIVNPEASSRYTLPLNNAYADAERLIEWAHSNFVYHKISAKDVPIDEIYVKYGTPSDHIMVYPQSDVNVLIPKSESANILHDPIVYSDFVSYIEQDGKQTPSANAADCKPDVVIGTVQYYYMNSDNQRVDVGEPVALVVRESVSTDSGLEFMDNVGATLRRFVWPIVYILVGILGLYILVSMIMFIIRHVKAIRKSYLAKKNKGKTPAKKDKTPANKAKKKSNSKPANNKKANDETNNTATREFD